MCVRKLVLYARHPDRVDDRRMIQLIAYNNVLLALQQSTAVCIVSPLRSGLAMLSRRAVAASHQDSLDSGSVRGIRARESHRSFRAFEMGDLLLQFDVQRVRPRKSAVAGAQPVLGDRILRRLLQPRLLSEAQIVAGTEVQVVTAADREVGALCVRRRKDLIQKDCKIFAALVGWHTAMMDYNRSHSSWQLNVIPGRSSRRVARPCSPRLR